MADPTDVTPKKLPEDFVVVPTAPLIFFDLIPTYGALNGIIQIEFATRALMPLQDGGVATMNIESGRLRCNSVAARMLISSLEGALKMLEQPQASPVSTGRLN